MTAEALFTPKETAATLKISMKVLMEHVRFGRIRFIDVGAGRFANAGASPPRTLQLSLKNRRFGRHHVCLQARRPRNIFLRL